MDAPSGGKLVEFSVSILYDGRNACRGETRRVKPEKER